MNDFVKRILTEGRYSRKTLLRLIAIAVTILPIKLIFSMIDTKRRYMDGKNIIEIPLDLPYGISFHDEIIVNKSREGLLVLSSRCSHLGCKIVQRSGTALTCPCHGSSYSLQGKVLSGPATHDLKPLRYSIDKKRGRITVEYIS